MIQLHRTTYTSSVHRDRHVGIHKYCWLWHIIYILSQITNRQVGKLVVVGYISIFYIIARIMIMASNTFYCKRIARTICSYLNCIVLLYTWNVHHGDGIIKTIISVCEPRRVYNDGFSNLQIMIRVRNY